MAISAANRKDGCSKGIAEIHWLTSVLSLGKSQGKRLMAKWKSSKASSLYSGLSPNKGPASPNPTNPILSGFDICKK